MALIVLSGVGFWKVRNATRKKDLNLKKERAPAGLRRTVRRGKMST